MFIQRRILTHQGNLARKERHPFVGLVRVQALLIQKLEEVYNLWVQLRISPEKQCDSLQQAVTSSCAEFLDKGEEGFLVLSPELEDVARFCEDGIHEYIELVVGGHVEAELDDLDVQQ